MGMNALLALMKSREFWENVFGQKKAEMNVLSQKILSKPVRPTSLWPLCGGDEGVPLLQGQGLPYTCGFSDMFQGKIRESFLHLSFLKVPLT